jgi:hypothetical protein
MTKFDPFQSFYLVSEGKRKKRWIGLNLRVMKNPGLRNKSIEKGWAS